MAYDDSYFQAVLQASTKIFNLNHCPATLVLNNDIAVVNQSVVSLWFKVFISGNSNWSLTTPSNGVLGTIGQAASAWFIPKLSRAKPAAALSETLTITIKAYTDSGYTAEVSSHDITIDILFEDYTAWPDIATDDFASGDTNGWAGSNIITLNAVAVETGGYCARWDIARSVGNSLIDGTAYITKSVTLPDKDKVRLTMFLGASFYESTFSAYTKTGKILNFYVKVGDEIIYQSQDPSSTNIVEALNVAATGLWTKYYGWVTLTMDLSAFRGQTVTLGIGCRSTVTSSGSNDSAFYSYALVDKIQIVGSD